MLVLLVIFHASTGVCFVSFFYSVLSVLSSILSIGQQDDGPRLLLRCLCLDAQGGLGLQISRALELAAHCLLHRSNQLNFGLECRLQSSGASCYKSTIKLMKIIK